MPQLIITDKTQKQIENGRYLLKEENFVSENKAKQIPDGTVVDLYNQKHVFVGKTLISRQNKGLGWVFTTQQPDDFDAEWIDSRLQQAIEKRQYLFDQADTTAFRLINGEGDGLAGVTIDWYDHFVQLNWYSRGIYAFREIILEQLLEQLPTIKGVYETKRFKVTDQEKTIELTYGQAAPQPLLIKENGVNFAVYLGSDWMTGIFLDQREVRQYVKTQSQSLTVLNLFSYTGAFSVAAAVGGAKQTVSVDVAKRSAEKTKEQFQLNGIEAKQPEHEIRMMDVFEYIQYAKRHHIQFDLVVCDPPSFARTKNNQFKVEKDYASLAKDLFTLTKPGGLCLLSTNHSGYFKQTFQNDIKAAITDAKMDVQLIQQFNLPDDFPTTADLESQYLKVSVYYRNN
ncbi:class I SAM-dependent rRNA methyltransferase [Fundicoccus culcitae]|uniref:Class I SAM-dependent rRNA methyltransferase n=1 Tax=Fundicoccus culcitae TaxID=2969821 RepID=A0ABY5P4Z3_9LACT|nr:class I SAM-dependent rRNA methyltransferase [Fundicoccus culcitae]UUX33817.1 class I SAM-dependent rRNA methyltransferase [Fundicoccus culcitae]